MQSKLNLETKYCIILKLSIQATCN